MYQNRIEEAITTIVQEMDGCYKLKLKVVGTASKSLLALIHSLNILISFFGRLPLLFAPPAVVPLGELRTRSLTLADLAWRELPVSNTSTLRVQGHSDGAKEHPSEYQGKEGLELDHHKRATL